jgi:hypothetical protein
MQHLSVTAEVDATFPPEPSPVLPEVTDRAFPGVFQLADAASIAGQHAYKRIIRVDLYLVIIAAALSSAGAALTGHVATTLSVISVAALALTLVVEAYAQRSRYERRWYGDRFVAESVKSQSWLYMMRAPPYDVAEDLAETNYYRILDDTISSAQIALLNRELAPGDRGITEVMRAVRRLPLADRRQTYLQYRLDDQMGWYSKKAGAMARSALLWFRLSFGARVFALISAVVYVFHPTALQLTQLFVAIAAAVTAWVQLGRHEELQQSYRLTAQRLSEIRASLDAAAGEPSLSRSTADAEAVMSAEFKAWATKRL